jgi:hypothetical protein
MAVESLLPDVPGADEDIKADSPGLTVVRTKLPV